jgi:hypothetical protein
MPEHIQTRYLQVGEKYHFADGKLAFRDRGHRLSTPLENTEVIQDPIAQERGWNQISISGTDRFRKEAYQQARLAGLEVPGYCPSELERKQLAHRMGLARGRDPRAAPSPDRESSTPRDTEACAVDLPREFVTYCDVRGLPPVSVLRAFIADLCGITSVFACPREDGYSSSGSDESRLAHEYFQRTFDWTADPEYQTKVKAARRALKKTAIARSRESGVLGLFRFAGLRS